MIAGEKSQSFGKVLNVSNLLSGVLILTAVSYHRAADVPASLLSFTIAWVVSRIFSFSGDVLPSFTLFGLLCAKEPDSPGRWVVSS